MDNEAGCGILDANIVRVEKSLDVAAFTFSEEEIEKFTGGVVAEELA